MSKRKQVIRVFEHERLSLSPNSRGEFLHPTELEMLYAFNDAHENKYFTGIRNGIKFNNYVGVIQVGTLTIEVLPKADKNHTHTEQSELKWRNALLQMLQVTRKVSVESISDANLKNKQHSLLDLYFDRYLREVSKLLHAGLIKRYRLQSSNTLSLKGRLNFTKHLQQNLVHQERFFTTHQVYDHEHLVNQILLKALRILCKIAVNGNTKASSASLILQFPEITEIAITKTHFDKLKLDRKSERYAEALKIAKLIILNYSPDLHHGQENLIAILFDMNKLWEEYVFVMLQKAKPNGVEVKGQGWQYFWENKTIRPDIVVTKKSESETETFVIDTKWKVIDQSNPSDDDLKQMFAYNMYWESTHSMLLYPEISPVTETFGKYHQGSDKEHYCKLAFVSVFDAEEKLNQQIGERIFEKLFGNNSAN
jgi:5-methylcytosine-specific restriction enzyme subunit McrC